MGLSPSAPDPEAGFATPAAMVFGLALALVATAMVARSVMILRLARADLARHAAEAVLDGAQLQAAATVIRAGSGGPYRWAMATDLGFAEALVESEADKLALADSGALPDVVLSAMAVADASVLKARLQAATGTPYLDVADLDAAPLWRDCAPSLVSSLGTKHDYARPATIEPAVVVRPGALPNPPDFRVGELWRIRITTAAGWRDDRLVRFTGDARSPVAVVRRVLSRTNGGEGRCEAVLAGS